jgi:hypothetical protein
MRCQCNQGGESIVYLKFVSVRGAFRDFRLAGTSFIFKSNLLCRYTQSGYDSDLGVVTPQNYLRLNLS